MLGRGLPESRVHVHRLGPDGYGPAETIDAHETARAGLIDGPALRLDDLPRTRG